MRFYFCGKYIHTDGDEKYVERDMYAALSFFRVLMIRMNTKSEKINLKISSNTCAEVSLCPNEASGDAYWWLKDNHIDCRD